MNISSTVLNNYRRIVYIFLVVLMCLPWVSPSWALGAGILYSLLIGNPLQNFTHKTSRILLQWSVVGLGFGMNFYGVWQAGKTGFGFTVVSIFGTLVFGLLLGRLLKVESQVSTLVSCGTSICGGSAIAAVGAVLDADAKAMSVSLCTVFMLNAAALFVFPPLGQLAGMDGPHFGLWSAIAIHDTSSVVGAAARYGHDALEVATPVKLVRALWIVPITFGIAAFRKKKKNSVKFPWFIVYFLVAVAITTLFPQYGNVYHAINIIAKQGLAVTLFFIGSGLSYEAISAVGLKPVLQGVLLWVAISTISFMAVNMADVGGLPGY